MKNSKTKITTPLLVLFSLVVTLPLQTVMAKQQNTQQTKQQTQQYLDDSVITNKVKHQLLSSSADLKGLTVTTNNGVVKLTGFTENQDKKALAESLATKVPGVKQVKNDLVVDASQVTASSYLSDSAITTKIKTKLLADSDIPSNDISVETKGGTVLLTGKVAQQGQLTKLLAIVNGTEGVQKVANQVKVAN